MYEKIKNAALEKELSELLDLVYYAGSREMEDCCNEEL